MRSGPTKLLTPAQARKFCAREEAEARRQEAKRLDPLYAEQLRQIVKMVGKKKVLRFLEKLQ